MQADGSVRDGTARQRSQLTNRAIEQKLPTLATKEDLEEVRKDLKVFATKDDLAEIRKDLKAFATKDDLKAFATKEEMREEGERTRRHFDIVAEGLKESIDRVTKLEADASKRR